MVDQSATSKRARRDAELRRREAESQLRLLLNEDAEQGSTDFYSYRYFASEGFLPGYSFPRLPLAAYCRVSGSSPMREGEFLQRPRFLAIREFGPGALIYHEGARYEVTRVQVPMASRAQAARAESRPRRRVAVPPAATTMSGSPASTCARTAEPSSTRRSTG